MKTLILILLTLIVISCKKEQPIEVVPIPIETGSIFIDTIIISNQTLVIQNTMQSDYDLNNHRITLGYTSSGYAGGVFWTTPLIIPAQSSLTLTPADVNMTLFQHNETFPLFARFFDENDNQFQEYLDQ